jgi:hypothetical protein
MPLWPLIVTLAAQTLATMARFSLPAIAPAVASALGVPGELVGLFVSVAYGTGIVSALLSPGFIYRYGGVRTMQAMMLSAAAMLLTAAGGSVTALVISAMVWGFGCSAAAPAGTHLLVPRTPRAAFNTVMSLRQIDVPLGGVLASLLLPPLVLLVGWRQDLLVEVSPILLLRLHDDALAQDCGAQPDPCRPGTGDLSGDWRSDAASMGLDRGSLAHPKPNSGDARFRHGSRRHCYGGPRSYLVALGYLFGRPDRWQHGGRLYRGSLAEYAHPGGAGRTEATGLGTAILFAGVLLIPSSFGVAVTVLGGYAIACTTLALLALGSALLLCLETWTPRADPV